MASSSSSAAAAAADRRSADEEVAAVAAATGSAPPPSLGAAENSTSNNAFAPLLWWLPVTGADGIVDGSGIVADGASTPPPRGNDDLASFAAEDEEERHYRPPTAAAAAAAAAARSYTSSLMAQQEQQQQQQQQTLAAAAAAAAAATAAAASTTPSSAATAANQHRSSALLPFPHPSNNFGPPESAYLTLIPLSDARLRPRKFPRALVALAAVFSLALAALAFLAAPRGVALTAVDVKARSLEWNATSGTYSLSLDAALRLDNPNWLRARIVGRLDIFFYDGRAGGADVGPATLPARSKANKVLAKIDASDVGAKYRLKILSDCAAFPRQLVFFVKGSVRATTGWGPFAIFGGAQDARAVDTYFVVPCFSNERKEEVESVELEERKE